MPKEEGGLGLRYMQRCNDAFLTKLAWQFLTMSEMPWVCLFRDLYRTTADLVRTPLPLLAIHNWKDIHYGLQLLQLGHLSRIGNGRSTHLWYDNWTGLWPLIDDSSSLVFSSKENLSVSGIITNGHWDLSCIHSLLPPAVEHGLLLVHISQDASFSDRLL